MHGEGRARARESVEAGAAVAARAAAGFFDDGDDAFLSLFFSSGPSVSASFNAPEAVWREQDDGDDDEEEQRRRRRRSRSRRR